MSTFHIFKKVASTAIGLAIITCPFISSAQTTSVQVQIDALLKQIQQLQLQIAALQGSSATSEPKDLFCASLNRYLVRGSVDEKVNGPEFFKGQVSYLQLFLQQYFDITDASFVDGVYGPNTEYYVVQFQKQNGIDATGTVGPITRARITRFCADPSPAATHTYTLGEQFPQSFTIYPGESYAMNDVAHGGYRIEYVSKNNQTIRVTNRTDGGLATEHLKLSEGAVLMAKHTWPTGLQITVNKFLSDGGVSLTLESVSTD